NRLPQHFGRAATSVILLAARPGRQNSIQPEVSEKTIHRPAVMCADNCPNSNLFYEVSCNGPSILNKTRHVRDYPSIIGMAPPFRTCTVAFVNGYQADLTRYFFDVPDVSTYYGRC
uniref:Uncharacterized protein n=1 Tax=Romanomermis culicivorax TaxID=13658 RepID=A0A915JXL0_ROMCU